MSTTPINSQNSNNKGERWNRASLLAAVLAGGLTVEAANLLLAENDPQADPITEEEIIITGDNSENVSDQQSGHQVSPEESPNNHNSGNVNSTSNSPSTPPSDPIPQPTPEPIPTPEPELTPEPEPIPEPTPEPVPVPEPNPDVEVFYGKDYTLGEIETLEDGSHIAHLISPHDGSEILMVDLDGDCGFDILQTSDGDAIIQFDITDINILNLEDLPEGYFIDTYDDIIVMYGPPEPDMYGPIYPEDDPELFADDITDDLWDDDATASDLDPQ